MAGRGLAYAERFDQGLKLCTLCGLVKSLSEFSPRNANKGDVLPRSRCKPCASAAVVALRDAGHNEYRKLQRYGLTKDQFDALVEQQGGCCAICGCVPQDVFRIDHDHKTGVVRGLLCFSCNVSLGHFRDDVSVMERAIDYIRRHTK